MQNLLILATGFFVAIFYKATFIFILCSLNIIFLFSGGGFNIFVDEEECPPALISFGGGYLHAGKRHSGQIFQVEYRWNKYLWHRIRPQFALLLSNHRSLYVGLGIAWEWPLTEHIILTPGFSPGLYYEGKGRNLGFPLEFRSSLELAYELDNQGRIGAQIYHLSNAHLSHKNPGCNAFTLFIAIPLSN